MIDTVIRYPGLQSHRQEFGIVAGVLASCAVEPHAFITRSVRIDNWSNRWLLVPPEWDFVPPFRQGVILNVRGRGTIIVQPMAPPGTSEGGETEGSYFVTMYDKPQVPMPAGTKML